MELDGGGGERMSILKYMVLLHTDVPRAAQFYAHGLGLAVNVCTTRWAELQSGPFKIALMEAPRLFPLPSSRLLVFLRRFVYEATALNLGCACIQCRIRVSSLF